MENYFLIVLVGLIFFWRAQYLGLSVDDYVWAPKVALHRKEKFSWKEWPIWQRVKFYLYGAGLFPNPKHDHVFSVGLHIFNASLIYSISNSLLASLLWLVCPVNNQVSLWLNGRRYSIAIALCLLAWQFKFLAIPLYIAAIYIHVSAVVFPLLLLLTPYWWVTLAAIPLFLAIGFPWMKATYISRKSEFAKDNELQKINHKKAILYVKSIGYNFFHTLFPFRPSMYHEHLFYFSRYEWANKEGYSFNASFFRGLVVLGIVLASISQGNIWAAWWLVFISLYSNIITVTMNAADRYCSLAAVGLFIWMASIINSLPGEWSAIVATALFVFYWVKYDALYRAYSTVENFYLYHINLQPDGVKQRVFLAELYLNKNDPAAALYFIKKGLKYRPKDPELLLMFAKIMFAIGKSEACRKVLDAAQSNMPIGEEEIAKKELDEIRLQLDTIEKSKPVMVQANRMQRRRMAGAN